MMAGHALVVPGTDQVPHREPGPAQRRQPGPPRPGEVLRRPGVVRRGRAARRRDPGLDYLDRVGQVEVRAGQARHGLVHHLLQPFADLRRRLRRPRCARRGSASPRTGRRAGQDPLRLGVHLGQDLPELRPAPVVGLREVEVGPVPAPRARVIALLAHAVRSAGRAGQIVRRAASHAARPPRRRRRRSPPSRSARSEAGPSAARQRRSRRTSRGRRRSPARPRTGPPRSRTCRGAANRPRRAPSASDSPVLRRARPARGRSGWR